MSEVEELKKKYDDLQARREELVQPINAQLEKITERLDYLSYEPIREAINDGVKIGVKGHWCGFYYEFDIEEWKQYAWPSAESFLRRVPADFYTTDECKITKKD